MALLLYDGDCGLCTRSVAWVRRHDRRGRVRAVPAQDPEGQAALATAGLAGVEARTLVLFTTGRRGRRAWLRSAGTVRLLWTVGGAWRVAGAALWLVPWPLRELGYRLVARNRRRFGHACPLPAR